MFFGLLNLLTDSIYDDIHKDIYFGVDPYFWEHFSHFHIDTIFFHYQYLSPSSSPLQYLVAFSILK